MQRADCRDMQSRCIFPGVGHEFNKDARLWTAQDSPRASRAPLPGGGSTHELQLCMLIQALPMTELSQHTRRVHPRVQPSI